MPHVSHKRCENMSTWNNIFYITESSLYLSYKFTSIHSYSDKIRSKFFIEKFDFNISQNQTSAIKHT